MKYTHKIIAELIKRTAKELGKNPHEITKAQILKADSNLTDWTLRNLGGLQSIKDRFFPLTTKDLVEIHETKDVTSYIKKLESQVANKESFRQKLLTAVEKGLTPLPKIKQRHFKPSSTEQERQLVLMLNDTHMGLLVHADEVNNVNSFGWKESCRRTAMMLKETLNYKHHNRNQVSKVHLVLNGDLIQGVIHGLQMDQMEKSIHQVNGAVHILTYLIAGLAQEFKEVQVHGICGNHEDSLHKREHGKRVNSEKYDSYANIIFYSLSTAFRNSDHVVFNVTKGLHLNIDLPAGRALVSHVDTDVFIFTDKLCDYVKNTPDNSWIGFWCDIHKYNETIFQVCTGRDSIINMKEFMTEGFLQYYPFDIAERKVPFTHIEKNFIGDRYPERGIIIQNETWDWCGQCPTNMKVEFKGTP